MLRRCEAMTPNGPCQRPVGRSGRCGVRHRTTQNAGFIADAPFVPAVGEEPFATSLTFDGADLSGQDLRDAPLHDVTAPNMVMDFALATDVDLSRSRLSCLSARAAHLSGAKVTDLRTPDSDFVGARFREAHGDRWNLSGSCARGMELADADVPFVDARGADLSGVDLTGTNMSGWVWDERTNWNLVTYSNDTVMPEDLELPPSALLYDRAVTDERPLPPDGAPEGVVLAYNADRAWRLQRSLTPLSRRALAAATAPRPMENLVELDSVEEQLGSHLLVARELWAGLRDGGPSK